MNQEAWALTRSSTYRPVSAACAEAAARVNPERLTDQELQQDLIRWASPHQLRNYLLTPYFCILYRHLPAQQRSALAILSARHLLHNTRFERDAVLLQLERTLPPLLHFAILIELGRFFLSYQSDRPAAPAATERGLAHYHARYYKRRADLEEEFPTLVPGCTFQCHRFEVRTWPDHEALRTLCIDSHWGNTPFSQDGIAAMYRLIARAKALLCSGNTALADITTCTASY